ncbi:MAG: OmpA family protein [Stenomitos frigidus ULC029]
MSKQHQDGMSKKAEGKRQKAKGKRLHQVPLWLGILSVFASGVAVAQTSDTTAAPALRVTVNSNQDGAVQADEGLTLREAIAIVNGMLPLDRLSPAEQGQVEPLTGSASSQIAFQLPEGQTTIRLMDVLPALQRDGLLLDGTTQPGYQAERSAINELPMPVPVVAIAPAEGKEVFRGLTVAADNITIRGLSLYGFTSTHRETASTPPADIFITHRLPPPDISKQRTPANFAPYYKDDVPSQNVVIENNWLGIPPSEQPSASTQNSKLKTQNSPRSAFGVSVFNGISTTIRRNWIADHDGSAIITSVNAQNLQVSENVIIGNGVAGMPDAIRLEGAVNQSQITGNLICANDGSGVYLFKPNGAVQIKDNQIIYNGRRLRRAAIYLMGSNHQVTGNQIRYQTGPGVVVAAYPTSRQNQIGTNRFSNLEGLSIDLVTRQGTGGSQYADPVVEAGTDVSDYQRGDGINPQRDTPNRRKETGNSAINAPRFASKEFFMLDAEAAKPSVQVLGKADPGSKIELYQVSGKDDGYGPLSEPIATTETDANGNFSTTIAASVGEQISAIATDPRYGSSEPARLAVVRSLSPSAPLAASQPPTSLPRCTTPVVQQPPPQPEPPPDVVRLTVPKNIHFALDKATISAATARVLDRIAQVLVENPYILVTIEGHTDPRATDAYNLALGERRAIAARNYLLRRGITPERMTIRSIGERQRLAPGSTRLDYARDRRAEFIYRDARDIEVMIQEQDLQIEP